MPDTVMALKLRKYWWCYMLGTVKFWGWWRHPWNWSWAEFKRACWHLEGVSGMAVAEAEIKRKLNARPKPPRSEAERARHEEMNAGKWDTAYFSIRYEDGATTIRGTTPYFLGELMKARYDQLRALYKLFPDDRLLLLELQARFASDWREVKKEWDQERATLTEEDGEG